MENKRTFFLFSDLTEVLLKTRGIQLSFCFDNVLEIAGESGLISCSSQDVAFDWGWNF